VSTLAASATAAVAAVVVASAAETAEWRLLIASTNRQHR